MTIFNIGIEWSPWMFIQSCAWEVTNVTLFTKVVRNPRRRVDTRVPTSNLLGSGLNHAFPTTHECGPGSHNIGCYNVRDSSRSQRELKSTCYCQHSLYSPAICGRYSVATLEEYTVLWSWLNPSRPFFHLTRSLSASCTFQEIGWIFVHCCSYHQISSSFQAFLYRPSARDPSFQTFLLYKLELCDMMFHHSPANRSDDIYFYISLPEEQSEGIHIQALRPETRWSCHTVYGVVTWRPFFVWFEVQALLLDKQL